jgi:hypothetical protein
MTDNATSSPSVSARTYDHASVISKTLSAIEDGATRKLHGPAGEGARAQSQRRHSIAGVLNRPAPSGAIFSEGSIQIIVLLRSLEVSLRPAVTMMPRLTALPPITIAWLIYQRDALPELSNSEASPAKLKVYSTTKLNRDQPEIGHGSSTASTLHVATRTMRTRKSI